jgi:rhamnose transport system ATP-binding protein
MVPRETSAPLLEMRAIRKSFNGVEVLHGVDFSVGAGQVHALVGENGAGKTTLMKILAGDLQADSGEVFLDGQRRSFRSPGDSQAAGIAMIQQELSYVPALTVAENLFLGRLPCRAPGLVDWRETHRQAQALLDAAKATITATARMDELPMSGRQVVEILRAVNRRARLVVMDEPTSSLTKREVDTLFATIKQVKSSGVAVVYISHHLEEIFSVASTVTVLRDGQRVLTIPVSEATHDRLVREMVGGAVAPARPGTSPSSGRVLLSVRKLSVSDAVRDVSFELREGEVLGLYGLVGAGQEMVARALFGIVPYNGALELEGKSLSLKSPRAAIAQGIGFVPSDRKVEGIVPRRPLRDNLSYPSLDRLHRVGFLRQRLEAETVRSVARALQIKAPVEQRVGSVSGGNQQKVVLGRWFARPVKLLVLMDPTRGVDVGVKAQVHLHIRELAEKGIGVLVVSADLPELLEVTDRIVVMRRGSVVTELASRGTSAEEVLAHAAGGAAA